MSRPNSPTVTRAKTMEVTPVATDRFRFTARLTDSAEHGDYPGGAAVIHDFGLEGECQGPDLTLVALDVRAYSHPYADCPFVIPATQRLVGQPLMSGWRKAVIAQAAGPAGCTHVNTLLIGLGELSTMVYFLKINSSVPYARETLTDGRWTQAALDVSPGLAGACHGLRTDGRALTAAREQAAGSA
ncbi:MAG TPA: DUF2889 domain-containing protein [Trebonia sp.]